MLFPFLKGISEFTVDSSLLHPVIAECRVFKSKLEMDVMRYSAKVTCDAHKRVMKEIKAGLRVRNPKSFFLFLEQFPNLVFMLQKRKNITRA